MELAKRLIPKEVMFEWKTECCGGEVLRKMQGELFRCSQCQARQF